jgi:type I restriction enzyme S subunit
MDVRKGYKQTEVGVIPEDWDVMTLGQLCGFIADGTHFTPKYVKEGVPFYSVENVTANNFTDTKFISYEEHFRLIKRCKPEKGDILLTKIGSIGDTKFIDWDVDASIYVSLALLRPNNLTLGSYIYNYSKANQFVRDVKKRSLINAVPQKINLGSIEGVPIPIPQEEAEQRAIAAALSDVDSLLTALNALIAKKRLIKQGAMQELLTGKKRLPGFSGEEKKPLNKICEIKKGEQLNRDTLTESGGYPVWNGGMEPSGYTDKWNTEKDAITISEGGNSCGFINFVAKKFWRGGHCYALKRIDSNVFQPYLYQYLKHREKDIMALRVGSGLPNIQRSRLSGFEIYLPTLPEQTAIAEILSNMDAEITALEARRQKTSLLKQGMMQELLTGRIRLI